MASGKQAAKRQRPCSFFVAFAVPTATHNDLAVRTRKGEGGKVQRFVGRGEAALDAAAKWEAHLAAHAPEEPYAGPLSVEMRFVFPPNGSHPQGSPKDTKPDLDNLAKTALDAMAAAGFFGKGDAQVAHLVLSKGHGEPQGVWVAVRPLEW